jgi:hypothetical protein
MDALVVTEDQIGRGRVGFLEVAAVCHGWGEGLVLVLVMKEGLCRNHFEPQHY